MAADESPPTWRSTQPRSGHECCHPHSALRANGRAKRDPREAPRNNPECLCGATLDCFVARAPRNDGAEKEERINFGSRSDAARQRKGALARPGEGGEAENKTGPERAPQKFFSLSAILLDLLT
jgi:hypothetical protein